ncbi:MAG: Zn-dependent protease with chaperone function, partial [Kiritimatiellia bacterium]
TVYPEQTPAAAVMARLADRLANPGWRVSCTVTDSAHQHAFALPGGFVFISYTLVQLCRNDDELAFVLGHELAHVVKRHAMHRLAASSMAGLFQKTVARRTPVIQLLGPFIGNLLEKGYREDQEFDADLYAVRLMKSARFDSRAGVTLLKRLQEVDRDLAIISPYFSAHPPLADRIAALEKG